MIQIGFVDSLSVGVEMPTETELEGAWNRLEAALAQLERDPTAERSQLRGAERHLAKLWRAERQAFRDFAQGNVGQMVFGEVRPVVR
jgi:hypothetical protein